MIYTYDINPPMHTKLPCNKKFGYNCEPTNGSRHLYSARVEKFLISINNMLVIVTMLKMENPHKLLYQT